MDRRSFLASSLALSAAASLPGCVHSAPPFRLYDTHVHFRSSDTERFPFRTGVDPVLRADAMARPITPEAVIAMWDEAGVEMGCGVQFNDIYFTDNRYLLDAAERFPNRISPVVVLDPVNAATPAVLKSMARAYRISGIRFAGRPLPDDHYRFLMEAAGGAWRTANEMGLVIVLLPIRSTTQPDALPAAMRRIGRLAARYPNVNIVIDHMGFPVAEATPTLGFSPEHLALAEHPNVYFKHTTFVIAQLLRGGVPVREFVNFAVEAFGAERFVWGSAYGNFMVRFLARSAGGGEVPNLEQYPDRVRIALDSAGGLTLAQKQAFFYDNAKALFVPGGRG